MEVTSGERLGIGSALSQEYLSVIGYFGRRDSSVRHDMCVTFVVATTYLAICLWPTDCANAQDTTPARRLETFSSSASPVLNGRGGGVLIVLFIGLFLFGKVVRWAHQDFLHHGVVR